MNSIAQKARITFEVPLALKRRLQAFAHSNSIERGHFISMQTCLVEMLEKRLPQLPGDANGKRPTQRAMRSAG